jgi:phosphatidate cytidylyltransferase
MLKTRLINGIIAGAILLSILFLTPSWLYLLVLLMACGLILHEFYMLLDAAGVSTFRVQGLAGAALYNLAVWLECQYQLTFDLELLALFIIVCSLFARQLCERNQARLFQNIGSTFFGIMYIAFLLSFITRLLIYDGTFSGQWLLFYLLVVIKVGDSGAYFAGTYLGRHKLAPIISPKKTWEGLVGGIATSMLVSVGIYFALGGDFGVVRMGLTDALALGFILPSIGCMGDLAESLIKRAAGVKDSSKVIKGLGGMLDMADSVLPAIPLLYFWCVFLLK